jgi:hypothetical protein
MLLFGHHVPGGNSSVVERHLAKVDVAGSTPVSRSKLISALNTSSVLPGSAIPD